MTPASGIQDLSTESVNPILRRAHTLASMLRCLQRGSVPREKMTLATRRDMRLPTGALARSADASDLGFRKHFWTPDRHAPL